MDDLTPRRGRGRPLKYGEPLVDFRARLPESLHSRLTDCARIAARSINDEIIHRCETYQEDTMTTETRTVADLVTTITHAHRQLDETARAIPLSSMLRDDLGETAYWAWDSIRRTTAELGREATDADLIELVTSAVADIDDVDPARVLEWIRPRQDWDD